MKSIMRKASNIFYSLGGLIIAVKEGSGPAFLLCFMPFHTFNSPLYSKVCYSKRKEGEEEGQKVGWYSTEEKELKRALFDTICASSQ